MVTGPTACLICVAAPGWHDFTITLADGESCRVRYLVKLGLSATRVEGSVQAGPTSLVTSYVTITGSGFYDKPTITSDAHTGAIIIHDHGSTLVVRLEDCPGHGVARLHHHPGQW